MKDDPPVQGCIAYCGIHIMQIGIYKRTFQPGQLVWDTDALRFQIFLSLVQVVFGHFLSQDPAAGMYDDVQTAFRVLIDLYKVVSSAKSPQTQAGSVCPYMRPAEKTGKVIVIRSSVGRPAKMAAGGHGIPYDRIQFFSI